jgi:hypothetical protein
MNTMNTLMTLAFFVPVALMVATNLLTARTAGPSAAPMKSTRLALVPQPTHRQRAANAERFLEAA